MTIGSVIYSMISIRPDITFSISLLSRFISNPDRDHWTALKWLLMYVNGTVNKSLHYHNWIKSLTYLLLVGINVTMFHGNLNFNRTRPHTTLIDGLIM